MRFTFNILVLLALAIVLGGCSSTRKKLPVLKSKAKILKEFKAKEITIPRGHGLSVKLNLEELGGTRPKVLTCDNQNVFFTVHDNILKTYLSINYYRPKNFSCQAVLPKRQKPLEVFKVSWIEFKFKEEMLNVPKKHIDLSPKNLKRWYKERDLQKKIYSSGVQTPYFNEEFEVPIESVITSPFGVKRIFNNKKNSVHLGTDFRAAVGVPIPAANRGRVVFAGDLFFNGNAVIIDHGLNIFTMYCHLSEIKAREGEIIPKGETLGLAGATGRVSGPHLHWGVKVNGNWVSGIPFSENSH